MMGLFTSTAPEILDNVMPYPDQHATDCAWAQACPNDQGCGDQWSNGHAPPSASHCDACEAVCSCVHDNPPSNEGTRHHWVQREDGKWVAAADPDAEFWRTP